MLRFAANLSLLYGELPFLERFAAAARDGFDAIEFQFPYEHAPGEIAARLADCGLPLVLFNAPPGDFTGGDRGLAALPGREAEFRAAIEEALRYAEALRCPRVHVMAGVVPAGRERAEVQPTYVANLQWAAALAARQGVTLLVEPINGRDFPRYFLNRQDHAHELVAAIGAPHVQVQMDLYHCQVVEGDVASKIRHYLPGGRVGHVQIAGAPERHEPDTGEQNYDYLLDTLAATAAACGWDGWVGCEYRPARGAVPGGTSDGLGWLRRWRARHAPG